MATYLEMPSLDRGEGQGQSMVADRTPLLPADSAARSTNWQAALPVLHGLRASMRELRMSDAASLLAALSSEEVARFIAPPPSTVAEFERFIDWAAAERLKGTYVCFAVVPNGSDTAVGIFQLRRLDAETAEWGFALGPEFWGTGIFADCAEMTVNFAFEAIGINRLEARAVVANGRGNGALRKAGARQEGVLRQSFRCKGQLVDQNLWSILRDDWRRARTVSVVH
jgi:RimJ/RimL family protein N-acetyltransferase